MASSQFAMTRRLLRFALLVLAVASWNLGVSFVAAPVRSVAMGIRAVNFQQNLLCRERGGVLRRAGSLGGNGLSGRWGCYKTEGDIDAYWKATGLPWLARKGLQLMDWGAGKNQNVREFTQSGDDIKMEYSFVGPGLGGLGFTETYTVGKGVQEITRMGGAKILVDPTWESESTLRVTNMNPAKQTEGWAKSLVSGGKVDAPAGEDAAAAESSGSKESGAVIDVHRFYMDEAENALVLEADSTGSGGPVVKWFLRKS
eukprot:gb/GFBE01045645.1/.p1 GENE.gb/GFBE01045645.1/~~gb/GFBE01045645.1/.p1  ORF type:complete len:257 (+),score=53.03 gb/GFBE01045645.1/:1-771(+)